jgi:hypothetical protein
MCIIAIQPMGVKIKESTLKNCWDANKDGAGIMYVENGKIIVNKEMHSFSEFMKLKKHADKENLHVIVEACDGYGTPLDKLIQFYGKFDFELFEAWSSKNTTHCTWLIRTPNI